MSSNPALELFQIVYTSASTCALSAQDLNDLLEIARRNNQSVNVSGILVYADRSFLQVLEGPRVAVEAIYKHITTDPRHCNAALVRQQIIEEREFGEWSMAYVNSDDSSSSMDGYVDYLRGLEKLAEGNGVAQKVLRGFFDGKWRSQTEVSQSTAA